MTDRRQSTSPNRPSGHERTVAVAGSRRLRAVADGREEGAAADPATPPATPADESGSTVDPERRLRHVLGSTLREERQRQGRTLAEVAEKAAVSLPYLSEVERGRKEVSSDVLHAVHTALGLELDEVLERATTRLRSQACVGNLRVESRGTVGVGSQWPQASGFRCAA